MSITQEYEEIREEMGHKKYDAISTYLDEICPEEQYKQYNREIIKLSGLPEDEWEKRKKGLEEQYGIIFLSDVLYKQEEWNKFEKWYEKKQKEYIETELAKFNLTEKTTNKEIKQHYKQLTQLGKEDDNLSTKEKRLYLYQYLIDDMVKSNEITKEEGENFMKDVRRKNKERGAR